MQHVCIIWKVLFPSPARRAWLAGDNLQIIFDNFKYLETDLGEILL